MGNIGKYWQILRNTEYYRYNCGEYWKTLGHYGKLWEMQGNYHKHWKNARKLR